MTYGEVQTPQKTNPMALIGMIIGIISVFMILTSCCVLPFFTGVTGTIFGIAAIILGAMAKKKIKEEGGLESQGKMASAALILGIIGTVLGVIGIAVAVIRNFVLAGPAIEQYFQDILNQLQ